MKTLQTIAAGVLVLGMGSAFAAEPVALNDNQMDKVSAGTSYLLNDIRYDAKDIVQDIGHQPVNYADVHSDVRDLQRDILAFGLHL